MTSLCSLLPDKDYVILESLLNGDTENVSPDFVRIDKMFKLLSRFGREDLHAPTGHRHLYNMFKILFSFNIPFNLNMLPLITTIYSSRMSGGVSRTLSRVISENGVYSNIINKDAFLACIDRQRLIGKKLLSYSCNLPIDIDNGIRLIIDVLDIDTKIISAVMDSKSVNAEMFDESLSKNQSPFVIINNIAYPKYQVEDTGNYEDL